MIERWEVGSEFHQVAFELEEEADLHWTRFPHEYLARGRDALVQSLRGFPEIGRLYLPAYLCSEVMEAIHALVPFRTYSALPFSAPLTLTPSRGDAVYLVNFFGLSRAPNYDQLRNSGALIIEDHTHDPWSDWAKNSSADFCLASLRKTLPLPVGAVLWSPLGHQISEAPETTSETMMAALFKSNAMVMKSGYLSGRLPASKNAFLDAYRAGESALAASRLCRAPSDTVSLLQGIPTDHWRAVRRANYDTISAALPFHIQCAPSTRLALSQVPFSMVLTLQSEDARDGLRGHLIENRVYPAILWPPTPDFDQSARSFAARMLSLHVDARYAAGDMERVAELVNRWVR